jgi:hypothetical protein
MKHLIKSIFLLSLFILTGACTSGPLTDQFLADLSASGGVLEVKAMQHLHDGGEVSMTPEGSKIFTNDLGYEVELKEAFLSLHALHLISQGSDPLCPGGMDQTIPLAAKQDLLGEDLVLHHMGSALIPMVFFCEFELVLGSEVHAEMKFHEGEDHGDAPNEPFHLAGTWTMGAESGDFSMTGAKPVSIHGIFKTEEHGEILEHPLHFHDGETEASVVFGTNYDEIFNGVDFKMQSPEEQLEAVYHNLPEAIHQDVGDHHGSGEEEHEHP